MNGRDLPNRGGALEKWAVRLIVPALFTALFLAMFWVAGPRIDWRAWFDGPERGTWRALTLNGEEVFAEKFLVTIADGEVVGGRDGCNYWSFDGYDARSGERIISSTLAGCSDTPAMATYRVLANGGADMKLAGEDRLSLISGRCRGEFRRWTREDEDAERARYEAEIKAQQQVEQRDASSRQAVVAAPVPPPAERPSPPEPLPESPAPPPLPEPASPGC